MAREIYLTKGAVALVDDEDFEKVSGHSWQLHSKGYAVAKIGGKKIFMHRFILNAQEGQEVDHRNRDRLDCQKGNLRFATVSQSNANRSSKNKTGYKGVSETRGKFLAHIKVSGRDLFLGRFDRAADAAKAYNEAAVRYFGEFAKLNEDIDF